MTRLKLSPITLVFLAIASSGLDGCTLETSVHKETGAGAETSTTDEGKEGGKEEGKEEGHETATTGGTGETGATSETGGPGETGTTSETGGTGETGTTSETGGTETGGTETGGTGDGDGEPNGKPNGDSCLADVDCMSGNCLVFPLLGGRCGECNEDLDCPMGGCTAHNPFGSGGSVCNHGAQGSGCESDAACAQGLKCVKLFDVLSGMIVAKACSPCSTQADCTGNKLCEPVFDAKAWQGSAQCVDKKTLAQDSYCDLKGHGDQVCKSGFCSVVDVAGLDQVGACGECKVDADCGSGSCVAGKFDVNNGALTGSTCQ
jgi:hypothetical protein